MKYEFNTIPVPASRPIVTKSGTHYGKKYTQFRKDIKQEIAKRYDLQNNFVFENLHCDIELFIPLYKTYPLKRQNELEGQYCQHIKTGDIDNNIKAILDAFNGVLYDDDNQVVSVKAVKRWSPVGEGGFTISVREV